MPVRKRPQDEEDNSRLYVWLEEPAVFVDTYSAKIFHGDGILRLALGESLGREFYPLWRTGIAMPVSDARRLIKRLNFLLADYDEYLEHVAEEEPEPESQPQAPNE
jgi:hypothetical protein